MAFCSNCGAELKDGVNFCPSCGKALKEPVSASASAAQENNPSQTDAAPQAGAQQTDNNTYYQPNTNSADFSSKLAGITDTPDSTADYDRNDIAQNKVYAILSYIGLLFLVPLLGAPNSKFARFHANQGIVLFIAEAALSIISAVFSLVFGAIKGALHTAYVLVNLTGGVSFPYVLVSVLNVIFTVVFSILGLLILLLAIVGIINAAQGRAKELPLIGKIRILK